MNSQRNAYANLVELAYAVTVHLRLWSVTFYTPTKD